MLKAQWLAIRAGFAALCGCAVSGALAAEVSSTVPAKWNVTPLRDGAYTETFSSPDAAWTTGSGETTNLAAYSAAAVPSRVNDWFNGATSALTLDTEGESITNALSESAGAVPATTDNPAYIDMLVRFDVLEDEPEASAFEGAKLALYATEISGTVKLVCWANSASYTSVSGISTGEWTRVTVKLFGDKFNVLVNDAVQTFSDGTAEVTEFTLASGGTLSGTIFRGTGNLANLYVGLCDPTYGILGATVEANKELDAETVTALNNATNVTKVQKWMADNKANVPADAADATILNGYMVGSDTPVSSAELSIASMEIVSPTQIKVNVSLTVGGTAKTGAINGILKLMGKASASDAEFTLLNETAITDAEFTGGTSAEYTFTIPTGGYHIFKPVISMQ